MRQGCEHFLRLTGHTLAAAKLLTQARGFTVTSGQITVLARDLIVSVVQTSCSLSSMTSS